jgi:hypothetical protein
MARRLTVKRAADTGVGLAGSALAMKSRPSTASVSSLPPSSTTMIQAAR